METPVICHTIPLEYQVIGRHVKHIRVGKVYRRFDYRVGTSDYQYVDLIDGNSRVLTMSKGDFELYFSRSFIKPLRYLFLGEKSN